MNITFKNHYALIGKHNFIVFLSLSVIKFFRGTCSSVKMLKGYMTRKSLGTPVLEHCMFFYRTIQQFVECDSGMCKGGVAEEEAVV